MCVSQAWWVRKISGGCGAGVIFILFVLSYLSGSGGSGKLTYPA